jgi:D-erythro-7,8-dihydroneopterin triphosphate epimerase
VNENEDITMPELDILRIRDLRVRCRVGVTPAERRLPQEVLVTVAMHADLVRAGHSDNLRDTVDYKAVKKSILAECESRSFRLIERMAQRIAELSLSDARVQRVDVVIQKPGALRFARCSEVEISRCRNPEPRMQNPEVPSRRGRHE